MIYGNIKKETKRRYVDAIVRFGHDGACIPEKIIWPDGREFTLRNVSHGRRAMSANGEYAMRYDADVHGNRRAIWLDVETGRWFVDEMEDKSPTRNGRH